nr:MAG TPA: hypothetical protein [Caudoviricetes sp.]
MKKKNKLYTANKWNQPLFAKGIDKEHQNVFDGFFSSTLNTPLSNQGLLSGNSSGLNYQVPQLSQPNISMPTDWSNTAQRNAAVTNSKNLVNGFDAEAAKNNTFKQFVKPNLSGLAKTGISAGGSIVGALGNKLISGGLSSGAGNAISSIGGTVGGALSAVNPVVGGIVSAASGIVGGGINAFFGMKTDQKKLNAANEGTNYLNSFISNASSFDEIQGPNAVANVQNAYKGGLFRKGKARRKNAALRAERAEAESWANRSVNNNINNIADTQMDNLLANYAAFGGPLGGLPSQDTGAIDYGFMSDYLVAKNKSAEAKNKVSTNVFGNLPVTPLSTFALGGGIHIKESHKGLFTKEAKEHGMGVQEFASHVLANKDKYSPEVVKRANFARNATKFALGGDMQTNGSDFSNGLLHIDAGGSHESSPYDGVQLGIDAQGKPNLVEEGETIFDDYVFSKRIKADAQTKKKFHVGKNANISYADLSKKLEKESAERPNDAVSQAGLEKQMHDLADEQERQKSEMQSKKAQEVFASLPPDQQRAIMQQVAMEEQQAQQQQMEQPTDEVPQQAEQQSVNEQIMQQPVEQPIAEEPQMNACGGKINKYDKGGDMKKKIYNALGLYTDSDFDKWALDQKVDKITDWENILKNKQFMTALSGVNPILSDAISRGYDFGTYVPKTNNRLTFDFTHGGWGKEDYDAWNGSTDAAWKEAVNKGLVKKGMNSEEIGKALSQTDAYRRGSDWLKADESNRLNYLQQILNSQDAPQAARDYAAKYVDANGWLKDVKRDYQTIFEDPNGTGIRNTHPGTYWKTPNEILRGKQTGNYVVNDDGSIEEIYGNVPKDWTSAGNYSWQDDKSDYTYNYYKRPVASTDVTDNNGDNQEEIVPKHRNEKLRYAGLLGPLVGLGMQAMGIGKPDYSRMDAAVEAASGSPALASYKPIGNYLTYNPMDIWYEQNKIDANSRATDRAILNNASPIGTKMAGLLANGYNSQIADGDLYRKALEYNDAKRQKVAEFNRGTDMYNADAFTKTSATNAEIANRQRQFRAQMQMDAARQRMAADAAWNQGIYGNVSGLFKGISDLGRENAQHNMIADMAADGIFGVMTPKSNTGKRVVTTKKSCGGKIKRKRGLTF